MIYHMKASPTGLGARGLVNFAHAVAVKFCAEAAKGFLCEADWVQPIHMDVTRRTPEECFGDLIDGQVERLSFLPFADPTLSVSYDATKLGVAAERIESMREVVAVFLASGGSPDAVRYWSTTPFPADLHAYAAFFKGLRFVLDEAARVGPANPWLKAWVYAGERRVALEGERGHCPACRIEHRKDLCDDVRDLDRPSRLAFNLEFKDGASATVSPKTRVLYAEARTLERLDDLAAAWDRAAREPLTW